MLGSMEKAKIALEQNGFCPFLVAGFTAKYGEFESQTEWYRYVYCSDKCQLYNNEFKKCSLGFMQEEIHAQVKVEIPPDALKHFPGGG